MCCQKTSSTHTVCVFANAKVNDNLKIAYPIQGMLFCNTQHQMLSVVCCYCCLDYNLV